MSRNHRSLWLVGLVGLLGMVGSLPVAAQAVSPDGAILDRAARAYDQGRCPEVLSLLMGLPPEQQAGLDGISSYRLGFCLGSANRGAEAQERYQQAATMLALETKSKDSALETHFYLVNALLNLERSSDARSAAQFAVERYRAGQLTVPETDAESWFRLGKLFRDAGDDTGAKAPFGRALDAAASRPGALRNAYLERIADHATLIGDAAQAERAVTLLRAADPGRADDPLRAARLLLAAGKYEEAKPLLIAAQKTPGEDAMVAQYAAGVVDRALELQSWNLTPEFLDAAGQPPTDLEAAIAGLSPVINEAIRGGRTVEAPRRNNKPGTMAVCDPDTRATLRAHQRRFTALLLEAVKRRAPIRQWAVEYGFPALVMHSWERLVIEKDSEARNASVIPNPVGN